jgi:capsular exopolysaccharide synthesis family protein
MSRIHEALKKAEQEKAPNLPLGSGSPTEILPADPRAGDPERASIHAASGVTVAPQDFQSRDSLLASARRIEWRSEQSKLLFISPQTQGFGPEQLRTLRSRLYQIRDRMPLKTVLVTSPLSGEGKTFVAANLAQTFARQHERRILIIDSDLRWSRMHALLGAQAEPGLTEYLQGSASETEILQRGSQDNLFFIPGGKAASNPAELLHSGRFKKLLDCVAPHFDWVILDTPPAGPVSDASLLADLCDGVLLVIRAGVTPYDAAQKITQEYREKRLVGVVLNRVDPEGARSAYGYEYYDYRQDGKEGENGNKRG